MDNCKSCQEDSPQTRLRVIRNKLCGPLRASHIAAVLEISDTTYYKMERQPFTLKPKQQENLSCAGIDPKFILFGDGCPFTIPVDRVRRNIIDKFPENNFPSLYRKKKNEIEECFEVKR